MYMGHEGENKSCSEEGRFDSYIDKRSENVNGIRLVSAITAVVSVRFGGDR